MDKIKLGRTNLNGIREVALEHYLFRGFLLKMLKRFYEKLMTME